MTKKNWKNIHPDFTETLKQEWKAQGFTSEQTKEWINADLTINEAIFANWLQQNNFTPQQFSTNKEAITQRYQQSSQPSSQPTTLVGDGVSEISSFSGQSQLSWNLKEAISKKIIKEAPRTKIEKIILPTFSVENQVIVITNWIKYAVRLITYEQNSLGEITITSNKRFPDSDWKSGYNKDEAFDKAEDLQWKLETNYSLKEFQKQNEELKTKLIETQQQLANSHKKIDHLQKQATEQQLQINQLQQQLPKAKSEVHNILLIGRTGQGKSTLANVLTNTNEFKEGNYGVSETKDAQTKEFTVGNINYRVIDTIGIGDTKLSEDQVLDKISQAAYSVKGGLHQILFVTSGRFDKAEIFIYDLLRKTIFDQDITKFTTIVRTRFPEFQKQIECQKDVELMSSNSGELAEVINSCNKVIHVNNLTSTEDPQQNSRLASRTKLLAHLATCQETYQPQNLTALTTKISKNMTKKEQLEKKLTNLKYQTQDKITQQRAKSLEKELNSLKASIRHQTSEHMEDKWSRWIDIATKVGSIIVPIAALVVSVACRIM